jgi:hypothetical protein
MQWFLVLSIYQFYLGTLIGPPERFNRTYTMPSLTACLADQKENPGSECFGIQIDKNARPLVAE